MPCEANKSIMEDLDVISIYCALYQEAQGLIKRYQLKKEEKQNHFQVFGNEEAGIRLTVTGTGYIAAAAAVAEISTCYPPDFKDMLLNFGSCASGEYPQGELCLCNKLTDQTTGRTFYPDIPYRHPFSETEIVSAPFVKKAESIEGGLYDMEAAAVYQAGSYYYGPHQMLFLKAVTDCGVAEGAFSKERFVSVMEQAAERAADYIDRIRECHVTGEEKRQRELERKVSAEAEELGEKLHCSRTMQSELWNLLYYWNLSQTDYEGRIRKYREEGRLPAKDKREGKQILEELKRGLL